MVFIMETRRLRAFWEKRDEVKQRVAAAQALPAVPPGLPATLQIS